MSDVHHELRGNAVLARLPAQDAAVLAPHLRHEPLALGRVLHEPSTGVDTVYFPLSGVVSIVADVDDDEVVDVATVGHEGMVGLSLYLGAESPTERALVQVAGEALSMSADDLVRCLQTVDGSLQVALRRYTQTMSPSSRTASTRRRKGRPAASLGCVQPGDAWRVPGPERYGTSSIDRLLTEARAGLDRVDVRGLAAEIEAGALVVDTRPAEQRLRDGALPGAVVVDRNVLEWRLDPTSPHRLPEAADPDRRIIIVCNEGFSSSLAAATLRRLGCVRATDLVDGFQGWLGAGHQPEPL